MSISNDYFFDVSINRAGQSYARYPAYSLTETGRDVVSEIGGGAELAAAKAHRRFSVWIDKDASPDFIHKIFLLHHNDVLDVTIGFYHQRMMVNVGFTGVKGTKIQIPVLQPLRIAGDLLATLSLPTCRFGHLSADQDGYSILITVQGDAKLNVGDQRFTSDFD
jgi:hypothetical protein